MFIHRRVRPLVIGDCLTGPKGRPSIHPSHTPGPLPGLDEPSEQVVELENLRMDGADLSHMRILHGKLPRASGAAPLFIDIIGMLLIPLSYAGVARRWIRRAVCYRSGFLLAWKSLFLRIALAWGALLLTVCAMPLSVPAVEEVRFESQLWNFYQWNTDGSRQNKTDVRFYQDVSLEGGWSVRLREDLPLIVTDKAGRDNVDGDWVVGLGDVFLEAVVTPPEVSEDTSLHVGLRLVLPTGGLSPFGSGTYQLGPMVAVTRRIPQVGTGLVLSPELRYLISVAKANEDASDTRKLQIYPHAELSLGEEWQLGLWAENPIIFNSITGRWFVPLDVMVTRDLGPSATLRLGGSVALLTAQPEYQNLIYGSLSFSF